MIKGGAKVRLVTVRIELLRHLIDLSRWTKEDKEERRRMCVLVVFIYVLLSHYPLYYPLYGHVPYIRRVGDREGVCVGCIHIHIPPCTTPCSYTYLA